MCVYVCVRPRQIHATANRHNRRDLARPTDKQLNCILLIGAASFRSKHNGAKSSAFSGLCIAPCLSSSLRFAEPRCIQSQPPAPAPSAPAPAASAAAAAAPNTITQAVPVATAVAAASTSEPPTQQPLGFSFATPVNGPSHTPQFPNFSPLFNYSGPPSAAQTPVVGANFQAQPHAPQAIRRSPRLEALRGVRTSTILLASSSGVAAEA